MIDDLVRLLQIEGVSVVGILLAFLLVAGVGLWRGWWVPGKEHAAVKAALAEALTELKAIERDYVETRIELAVLRDREGTAPARRRTRAS